VGRDDVHYSCTDTDASIYRCAAAHRGLLNGPAVGGGATKTDVYAGMRLGADFGRPHADACAPYIWPTIDN
jgi:hypothetical protein